MNKTLFLFCFLCSSIAFAKTNYSIKIPRNVIEAMDLSQELQAMLAGGDIIGNGGGLAEQEFRFAYLRVPSVIEGCLTSPVCTFSEIDKGLLRRIKNIAKNSIKNKDRLIFLSEKKYPGFFRDNETGPVRIAKTAFIPGAPIFINLDMIYQNSLAVVDFPLMVSILIHELGHQADIRSHSRLDEIGSWLREYILQDSSQIIQEVGGSTAIVKVYNLKEANKFSEVFFSYHGMIISLKERIKKQLSCKNEKNIPIGYEISNLHWLRQEVRNRFYFKVPIKGWIKTYCLDIETSAIWKVDGDFEARFQFYNEGGKVAFISSQVDLNN